MPSITIKDNSLFEINKSCTLIIKSDEVNIEYNLKDGEYNILIFNDADCNIVINDKGHINNSIVKLNYLELNNYDYIQNSNVEVDKSSQLFVVSTYLGVNSKKIIYDLVNAGKDTVIDITNNIICLDKADFSLDCIGTIKNGAKRSICHQKSHCLTLDNPKKARVLPVLNIDENDVEASHSLSSGTLDEDILFYMNSRGLDKKAALGLILRSYLMPNDNYYDGFIDGDTIKTLVEGKVNHLCSI
ncbi:MAG: SufD family Fe-S cluster assembly protein [Erysipelotrichaceae bacterium]|nr:SufD family Fe-S cluster assembly protein [Erysipelotrichaceae bacterium]